MSCILTRNALKLYIRRRPIDVVADTVKSLATGEAVEEELDALI